MYEMDIFAVILLAKSSEYAKRRKARIDFARNKRKAPPKLLHSTGLKKIRY